MYENVKSKRWIIFGVTKLQIFMEMLQRKTTDLFVWIKAYKRQTTNLQED